MYPISKVQRKESRDLNICWLCQLKWVIVLECGLFLVPKIPAVIKYPTVQP